jgi:exonuclease SbcD
VYVSEAPRAGLREQVQELFPRALEIRVDSAAPADKVRPARVGKNPSELFADYLAHKGSDDKQTQALFDRLYDEVMTP